MAKRSKALRDSGGTLPSWWARLAWRLWSKRRAWRELEERLHLQKAALEELRPWCRIAAEERQRLRSTLNRVLVEVQECGLDASLALAALGELATKISTLESGVQALVSTNAKWNAAYASIETETLELRKRSSVVPGREFARRTDELCRLLQHPDRLPGPHGRKKPGKGRFEKVLDEYFATARHCVQELRDHITTAEEAIQGIGDLDQSVARIEELVPETNVAAMQDYERLLAVRRSIRDHLTNGRYQAAYHHIKDARTLCARVQHTLEKQHEMTRQEIDLWMEDPAICSRFDLQSFPKQLGAAHVQRWNEIRVEIAGIINERAETARQAHAALFPKRRRFRGSLEELSDWERLEKYAHVVAELSRY